MARIHHINGWMRRYKEMGDKKEIPESDKRIQFLRAVADTDQSKIDIINEYMERVEELGHFSEVEPDNATLDRCIRELKAIQENYEKDEKRKKAKTLQRIARAKRWDKQNRRQDFILTDKGGNRSEKY